MKNLFLISISLLILASCSSKEKKLLCKRWQVYDVVFMNEKEATVQSDTMQGNMQKVTENILKDILMKNIYEFNTDGTYKTGNASASSTGKWELNGKKIKFILDNDNSKLIMSSKLSSTMLA